MLNSPYVHVFVEDEDFEIPFVAIKDFKFVADIHSSYPYGELTIDDSQGKYLSVLRLKPGNSVRITIIPQYYENNTLVMHVDQAVIITPSLRIVGIENKGTNVYQGSNASISSIGGDIILKLAHPWELFSDYTSHSYKARCSDIIEKVITNTKRGFSFNTPKIDKSDDEGTIIRYKLGESEASFIQQKILPYTAITGFPAYSFVNERGVFHLHNFKTLYESEPKATILPTYFEGMAGVKATAADLERPQLQILNGAWIIGKNFSQQLGNFRKTILLDAADIKTAFRADVLYKPSVAGPVLLKQSYITAMDTNATSLNILPFREFEDALRVDINSNSVMDTYFNIEITTTLAITIVSVGETVQLFVAQIPQSLGGDATRAQTTHWVSGKWVVTKAVHFAYSGSYYSRLTLSKPSVTSLNNLVDLKDLYVYKPPKNP